MRIFYLTISLLITLISANAQDPYEVLKIEDGALVFDGLLQESFWSELEPLDLFITQPVYGGTLQERSDIYLTYDNKYVYLAGRLYVSDPGLIGETGKTRDMMKPNSDYFGLLIDSFNDNENSLAFFTTPAGQRVDIAVFNDAQGEFPVNVSWDTFWDVKVVKTDSAWYSEIRVPFSSLRFQDEDGDVTMGITVWRWVAGISEQQIFPKVRNDLGPWSDWKPSQARKVNFKGIFAQKPVYLTPYILAGVQTESILNPTETAYVNDTEPVLKIGGDLKYSLTSNLTLDVTVNPDFAQVEVDDQQVNLTRFSLFFPEKRRFFQERSSVFNFNMGGSNTLFYSRRIGISEEEIVPIYGGVKVVGRAGHYDLGLLNMQTAKTSQQPTTNYGVLRMRRNILNSNTYVGFLIANQLDDRGDFNTAVGVDGVFRVVGDDYLNVNIGQTYENGGVTSPFNWNHTKIRTKWERRSLEGLSYDLSYNVAGSQYNPSMGFEVREDYTRMGNRVSWGWQPEDGLLYRHAVAIDGSLWKRNGDWGTQSSDIGLAYSFQTRTQWTGSFKYGLFEEDIDEAFDIGEATIPLGRYQYHGAEILFNTSFIKPMILIAYAYVGGFYDGRSINSRLDYSWSPTPGFELGLRYEYNRGIFSDRDDGYLIQLVSSKASLMFTTAFSATIFLQYNTNDDQLQPNIRFRYNPREGNDLFIVYNDALNTERHIATPSLPLSDVRALVIKYTYTFAIDN